MSLIFDIGASDGADTAVYLESGHKVVAVEANPDLCEEMRRRFAAEIADGRLVLVNRAISRRRKAVFYVNTAEPGWGTTVPSYAEDGANLRGEIRRIEVETTTIIDLIRQFGTPDYLKVDIEGADLLCLHGLFDSDLPRRLSIERPKSFSDQIFALELMRRLGYRRFAFVSQRDAHDSSSTRRTSGGVFGADIPRSSWTGWAGAAVKDAWLHGAWAVGGLARRVPILTAFAPGHRWYDIQPTSGG